MEYVAFLTGMLVAFYTFERLTVQKIVRSVPLRIAVTGTRGKSSVTRLIAAGLSAGGHRVLAKTTGSKAVVILPSGAEVPLRRRGFPSILEQLNILNLARRQHVHAAVLEVMSTRQESYEVELRKLVQPDIVVITNVRPDHLETLGESIQEIGAVFAFGVPKSCRLVVFDQDECPEILRQILKERGLPTCPIDKTAYEDLLAKYSRRDYCEWENNVRLALAVCEALGVSPKTALRGMLQAHPDFGALRIWHLVVGDKHWFAVNAFAANDPVSTKLIYDRVRAWNEKTHKLPMVGLLNLRADRKDRTLQWLQALSAQVLRFEHLFVSGVGAHAVAHTLRAQTNRINVSVLRPQFPEDVMNTVLSVDPRGGIIFGFGNIAGIGAELIEYWEKIGNLYDARDISHRINR